MDFTPKSNANLNIVRVLATSGTIYTTPSDKEFYLTNIVIESDDDSGIMTDSIAFTVNGNSSSITVNNLSGVNSTTILNIQFPKSGILLASNSTITCTSLSSSSFFMVCGFTQDEQIYETVQK